MSSHQEIEACLWVPRDLELLHPNHLNLVRKTVGGSALELAMAKARNRQGVTGALTTPDDVYLDRSVLQDFSQTQGLPKAIFNTVWGRMQSRFSLALACTPQATINKIDHTSPLWQEVAPLFRELKTEAGTDLLKGKVPIHRPMAVVITNTQNHVRGVALWRITNTAVNGLNVSHLARNRDKIPTAFHFSPKAYSFLNQVFETFVH